jgi:hypothetical protein
MPFDHKIPDPPGGGFRDLDGHEQWEAVAALDALPATGQPVPDFGQAVQILPGV